MGRQYEIIDDKLAKWVARQKLFFVATAPLQADGFVNCSPKGRDSLRILGPREVAYLDLPGSGIETVARVRENRRIVVMLCAFDGPPKIVRFHGLAEVIDVHNSRFGDFAARFPAPPRPARAVIRVDVTRISDSCGYGVPLYTFESDRRSIENLVASNDPDELAGYMTKFNRRSLDGLPGIDPEAKN